MNSLKYARKFEKQEAVFMNWIPKEGMNQKIKEKDEKNGADFKGCVPKSKKIIGV